MVETEGKCLPDNIFFIVADFVISGHHAYKFIYLLSFWIYLKLIPPAMHYCLDWSSFNLGRSSSITKWFHTDGSACITFVEVISSLFPWMANDFKWPQKALVEWLKYLHPVHNTTKQEMNFAIPRNGWEVSGWNESLLDIYCCTDFRVILAENTYRKHDVSSTVDDNFISLLIMYNLWT